MVINSRIDRGIIYTEIVGVLTYDLCVQHIDFIYGLRGKIDSQYELHDFSQVESIELSGDDMSGIVTYAQKAKNIFRNSYLAIYANSDLTFGLARMFETYLDIGENPTIIKIFRNKEDAIRFLNDAMEKWE